jgi:hypothetical protein
MYTGAGTSAQAQAATRYFLAATAILDDALDAYIGKNWERTPKGVSNLAGRISFLTQEGRLAEPTKLEALRLQRNQYAHEPEKDSNLTETLTAISDIQTELSHLRMRAGNDS